MRKITVALAGNPNSGKTTVFNNFTGARQHVGNYPGVTVEKKEGSLRYRGYDFHFVDLPGTYSLTAYSRDELVARDFLVEQKPDVVVNVVDSTNLERNLYLTVQLMELGLPLVVALNMSDLSARKGIEIDTGRLGELLGAPCVQTVAADRKGMDLLLDAVIDHVEGRREIKGSQVAFSPELEARVEHLAGLLAGVKDPFFTRYPARWLAIKLLEGDAQVRDAAARLPEGKKIAADVEEARRTIKTFFPDKIESLLAQERYGLISGACQEAVRRREDFQSRHDLSDRIDLVLLNRFLGLPIFLFLMWLVFRLVFTLSEPLMEAIEALQGLLGAAAGGLLPAGSAARSLVADGIIGGVGAVLVFVPVIFLLFLAVSFLEDSGYMARAAFLMDKLMHRIGLHGRSFIPMLLGFGCNVPAIMSARTIGDEKDRLVTILVNPFMSCGARLPVYTLLIGAFFPAPLAGNVLFSIYLLGMAVAVLSAKLFRKTILRGEAEPFVMELPPYRMPTFKGIIIHMWERGSHYLKKAGTVIFAGVMVIWFLSNFPWVSAPGDCAHPGCDEAALALETGRPAPDDWEQVRLENSYAARIGRSVAPVFRAQGFDDWKISVGLLGGFVAKEVVVGTLGTLYAAGGPDGEGDETLRGALRTETRPDGTPRYNPLVAYALMVFVLLYVPCVAVLAVIWRETGSWRWPIFAAAYSTGSAWIVSALVYRVGGLFF